MALGQGHESRDKANQTDTQKDLNFLQELVQNVSDDENVMLPIVKKEDEATEGEKETPKTIDYVMMTKEEVEKLIEKGKLRGIVLDNVNFIKIRANGVLETKKADNLDRNKNTNEMKLWKARGTLNTRGTRSKLRNKLEEMLNEDDKLTKQLKELEQKEWDIYINLLILFYSFFSEENTINGLHKNLFAKDTSSDTGLNLCKYFVAGAPFMDRSPFINKKILTKLYHLVEENDLVNEFKIDGNLLKAEKIDWSNVDTSNISEGLI